MKDILIRNAEIEGRLLDIAIHKGRITRIGAHLRGEELWDAEGAAVIPGLHDHHIHLMATAALRASVALDDCRDPASLTRALRDASVGLPEGAWLRATGYHESMGVPLDRGWLDEVVPDRPVRVQHQTGGLWILNSKAIAAVRSDSWPEGAERGTANRLTGRLYRCDRWLSQKIGRILPDLGRLGSELASFGITGVTDASVTNDHADATALASAVRDGRLPLRLTLMSGGPLRAAPDQAYTIGPVKILLDDDRLPTIDELTGIIEQARAWGRPVAAHCVTAGELAIMLAAFGAAGSAPGDRIEHGSIIPIEAIPVIKALQLAVVSQPAFLETRGDRYLRLVDRDEQSDLYRCASLIGAGIPLGGSSDGPYGPIDPWTGVRVAASRRTANGRIIGDAERIGPARALGLYLTTPERPGAPPKRLRPGIPADLCILEKGLRATLTAPNQAGVAVTVIAGKVSYAKGKA